MFLFRKRAKKVLLALNSAHKLYEENAIETLKYPKTVKLAKHSSVLVIVIFALFSYIDVAELISKPRETPNVIDEMLWDENWTFI